MTDNFERDVARRLWDNYYVPFVRGWFAATGRFRSDDIKTGNVLAWKKKHCRKRRGFPMCLSATKEDFFSPQKRLTMPSLPVASALRECQKHRF